MSLVIALTVEGIDAASLFAHIIVDFPRLNCLYYTLHLVCDHDLYCCNLFFFFFSYYSTNSPSDWSLVSKVVIPKVRYHIFTRNSWKIKMVFLICIYYIFIHSFANTRNAMTAQFNIPSWRRQPIIWRTGQFFSWPLLFVLVFFGISFAYFFIFLLFLHSLCFPTTAIVLRTTVSKLITTPTFL